MTEAGGDHDHGHAHAAHDGHPHETARASLQRSPVSGPAPLAVTIYTCPMHPQIRRPAPGSCPICGMALEPEMPSLEEEGNPELDNFTRRFWWTLPLTAVGVALAMGGHRFVALSPRTMSGV
ncbi:MAG TPA: heavy metal-binding domain-containing protein, partial [Casimicrobiaceae bacterium]|nr:heavy metal-binding domain-containing protein [Casimicrobiaceae bacterium]